MKELRLLAIIICVLQSLDFVETSCTHPFGTGTFISSTRGILTTTNTTISNYKIIIGALSTTITLTCYTQNDTNRYIFYNYYPVVINIYLNIYTCLDIRNSTSDRHYVYEATEATWSGDHFTADSSNVCNRANYLTAVETTIVIRQGAYNMNKINCPSIILGNYTYNTTDDYSDVDSCNNMQQLTFYKNKATYVALSSGGNLACMYSGTGDYVYLITFNNDVSVDSKNTYQFTCFAFSFSGYGSVVYASQRPKSCSSFQTPTDANSTQGKTFIFTPYAILDTSTENKAAVDLYWVFGLIPIIGLVFITVNVIACFIFKKDKVSSSKPFIMLEEGRDGTPTPSSPPSLDKSMTQFNLGTATPSVQSFKGQDDTVEDKNVGVEENLLKEDEVINLISGEPVPENKEVIKSIHIDTLPEEKEVAKLIGGEPILEDGDEKLKEDIEVKSITGDDILLDNIEENEKEKTKAFEEDKDHNDKLETEEKDFKTTKEVIMQEEDLMLNQDDALFIFGLDGPLPPGYTSDKDGIIIREKDGNIVVTAQKKHELRNKIHHLFNVPRLLREDRGRPVGRSRGTPLKNVGWEDKRDINEYSGRRIYLPSGNIAEEVEKKKNLSLSPQERRVLLARAKSVGSAEREQRVNRRTFRIKPYDPRGTLPVGGIPEETGSKTDDTNWMERTLNGPCDPGMSPAFYPRYDRGHNGQPSRESTMFTETSLYSMLTADLNEQDISDRDLKQLLEELYMDKKYFDYCRKSEVVPTHAGVHTRDLAQSVRGFLLNRADFWHERNLVPPRPPPSELGMHMSHMQTIYTIADSGYATMTLPTTGRPYSADDLNLTEWDNVRRLNEENSMPSNSNNTVLCQDSRQGPT